MDDLLDDHHRQMEELLDLYLTGGFARDILAERQERLRATKDALEEERMDLAAQLAAQTLTDEQVQTIVEFAEEMRQGLGVVEEDFEAWRRMIELLDVWGKLPIEDGDGRCSGPTRRAADDDPLVPRCFSLPACAAGSGDWDAHL